MLDYKVLAEKLKGAKINGEELTLENLEKAAKADEVLALDFTGLNVLTDNDIDALKSTVGGGSMKEGVISGAEQMVKSLKKITGLDYEGKVVLNEGKVDFESTAKTIQKHLLTKLETDLKLPAESKVKELSESLEKIRGTYEQDKQVWESEKKNWESEKTNIKKDFYLSKLAANVKGFKPEHVIAAFKADGYSIDFSEDGAVIPVKNGKPLKDKLEKPLNIESVFNDFVIENNYISPQDGRGSGNDTGASGSSTFKTEADVYRHMEQNKIDPMGADGQNLLAAFRSKGQ